MQESPTEPQKARLKPKDFFVLPEKRGERSPRRNQTLGEEQGRTFYRPRGPSPIFGKNVAEGGDGEGDSYHLLGRALTPQRKKVCPYEKGGEGWGNLFSPKVFQASKEKPPLRQEKKVSKRAKKQTEVRGQCPFLEKKPFPDHANGGTVYYYLNKIKII